MYSVSFRVMLLYKGVSISLRAQPGEVMSIEMEDGDRPPVQFPKSFEALSYSTTAHPTFTAAASMLIVCARSVWQRIAIPHVRDMGDKSRWDSGETREGYFAVSVAIVSSLDLPKQSTSSCRSLLGAFVVLVIEFCEMGDEIIN